MSTLTRTKTRIVDYFFYCFCALVIASFTRWVLTDNEKARLAEIVGKNTRANIEHLLSGIGSPFLFSTLLVLVWWTAAVLCGRQWSFTAVSINFHEFLSRFPFRRVMQFSVGFYFLISLQHELSQAMARNYFQCDQFVADILGCLISECLACTVIPKPMAMLKDDYAPTI